MKTDVNGCSTLERPGEENYEVFYSEIKKKDFVQYEYRHTDGSMFTTVAATLALCRRFKDEWVKGKKI